MHFEQMNQKNEQMNEWSQARTNDKVLLREGRCSDAVGSHHAGSGHRHNHKWLGHHVCHLTTGIWVWSGRSAWLQQLFVTALLLLLLHRAMLAVLNSAVCIYCCVPATRLNKYAN